MRIMPRKTPAVIQLAVTILIMQVLLLQLLKPHTVCVNLLLMSSNHFRAMPWHFMGVVPILSQITPFLTLSMFLQLFPFCHGYLGISHLVNKLMLNCSKPEVTVYHFSFYQTHTCVCVWTCFICVHACACVERKTYFR